MLFARYKELKKQMKACVSLFDLNQLRDDRDAMEQTLDDMGKHRASRALWLYYHQLKSEHLEKAKS